MLFAYHPNVTATIKFLESLNVNIKSSSIDEVLQSHPDWPSLLCISDSLKKWNIPNAAGNIPLERIDEIPTPFMALMRRKQVPLTIVTKVTPTHVEQYTERFNKKETVNREDFFKFWKGVYLIAEPTESSGINTDVSVDRKIKTFFNNGKALFVLIVALIAFQCYIFFTSSPMNILLGTEVTSVIIQFSFTLIGFLISLLLLWYEIDKNNILLQKVCTGIAKGNCSAILSSRGSRIFNWLNWSEVGFTFFASSFLFLIFSKNVKDVMSTLFMANIFASPYILYSIYYQWKIAKQWCVLCLGIQAVIFGLLLNALFYLNTFSLYTTWELMTQALTLLISVALFWFSIKPFLLKIQTGKNARMENRRVKYNSEVFDSLLKKQRRIEEPDKSLGIELGNSNAVNKIVKVCNPYCNPCSVAHQKIEQLLKTGLNLSIRVIYTAPNNEENLMYNPVRHFLALANENNRGLLKEALDAWHEMEEKDYEVFARKFPYNEKFGDQGNKIEAMRNWCQKIEIDYTPTIFLNGYQIPDLYDVGEIEYFLLE